MTGHPRLVFGETTPEQARQMACPSCRGKRGHLHSYHVVPDYPGGPRRRQPCTHPCDLCGGTQVNPAYRG